MPDLYAVPPEGKPPLPDPATAGTSHMEAVEREIAALEQRFPGWDVHRVAGMFVAVPAGTALVMGMFTETLAEKLAAREEKRS